MLRRFARRRLSPTLRMFHFIIKLLQHVITVSLWNLCLFTFSCLSLHCHYVISSSLTFHQSLIPGGVNTQEPCEHVKARREVKRGWDWWCYSFSSSQGHPVQFPSCFIFYHLNLPWCVLLCVCPSFLSYNFHSVLLWPCWAFSTSIQPLISMFRFWRWLKWSFVIGQKFVDLY